MLNAKTDEFLRGSFNFNDRIDFNEPRDYLSFLYNKKDTVGCPFYYCLVYVSNIQTES